MISQLGISLKTTTAGSRDNSPIRVHPARHLVACHNGRLDKGQETRSPNRLPNMSPKGKAWITKGIA